MAEGGFIVFPVICCKNITKIYNVLDFFETPKIYGIYSLDLKKLIVGVNICDKKGQILKSNYPQTDLL